MIDHLIGTGVPASNSGLLAATNRLPAWALNGMNVTCGLALTQYSIHFLFGAEAGQLALGAAVCASLADVVTTSERVARRVFAAIVGGLVASCAFLWARPFGAMSAVAAVVVIFFGAMMIQSWGTKAGAVSFSTALSLVFAMSLPQAHGLTWHHVLWSATGSAMYFVWAVGTSRLLQSRWRTQAVIASLDDMAGLLDTVARRARDPVDPLIQADLAEKASTFADRLHAARDLAFNCHRVTTAHADVWIVLSLMDLREVAITAAFEIDSLSRMAGVQEVLVSAGRVLAEQAGVLREVAGKMKRGTGGSLEDVSAHGAETRQALEAVLANRNLEECDLGEALQAMIVHVGSIRTAALTGAGDPASNRHDLRRYVAPDDWSMATIRSNLHLVEPVFRHAIRASVAAGAAYAVARELPWTPHPQWVVLTIAAVLQGSLAQTLARRNSRVTGTFFGCIAVAILTAIPEPRLFPVYFLVASGIAHAFFGIRYSVTAGAAAVMAILQAYIAAPSPDLGIEERFIDTLAGAFIGWAAAYALPTWEDRRLCALLDHALLALNAYAREALKIRSAGGADSPEFTRQQAYDAIGSLLQLQVRSRVEPISAQVAARDLSSWLVAAYASMSHLSCLRLALSSYAASSEAAPLEALLANPQQLVDRMLRSSDGPVPALSTDTLEGLSRIPGLQARIDRIVDDIARLVSISDKLRWSPH